MAEELSLIEKLRRTAFPIEEKRRVAAAEALAAQLERRRRAVSTGLNEFVEQRLEGEIQGIVARAEAAALAGQTRLKKTWRTAARHEVARYQALRAAVKDHFVEQGFQAGAYDVMNQTGGGSYDEGGETHYSSPVITGYDICLDISWADPSQESLVDGLILNF